MNRISVIVVNWNAKELLRECLKAVCDSIDGRIDSVIVVDNGSIGLFLKGEVFRVHTK